MGKKIGRFLPLFLVLAAAAFFFLMGWGRYVSFQSLAENRLLLLEEVARLGLLAFLLYIGIYAALAAISVPAAAVLTMAGGFLFGVWFGGLAALTGATLGATLLFLVAQTSLGELLRRRAGPFIRRLEEGFKANEWSYMFILRLIPIPFWVVNLVPALLGVRLRVFVVASFFGMAPGAFVYASLGNGLGALFEKGESPNLKILFEPRILWPILALIALALVPVVVKWVRARRQAVS
ncbi:MAG TPA: VTT domain-containing protein [Stellaceae bacterium]|nr:VTT domain-containing protein [Stellaceae bacterium]